MTIKQIFDTLETYNECCTLCNEPSRYKMIKFKDGVYLTDTFYRYYQLIDTLESWYRPEFIEAILDFEFYEPGKEVIVPWVDIHGNKHEAGEITISYIDRYEY